MDVTVPARAARPVAHRAAHHHHLRDVGLWVAQELAGDIERLVGDPEVLDDVGRLLVDKPAALHHDSGLPGGFVHPPGRVVRLAVSRPDYLLSLQDRIAARAHGFQLVRRDDVAEDEEPLLHELVSIYLHDSLLILSLPLSCPPLCKRGVRGDSLPAIAKQL